MLFRTKAIRFIPGTRRFIQVALSMQIAWRDGYSMKE